MRIRLDRYEIKHVSLQTRSILYFVVAIPTILVASFLMLIGVLIIVMPDGSSMWDRRGGFFLAIFTGLMPISLAVVAMWRGFVGRKRIKVLRELAAIGRVRQNFYREDVQQALGLSPQAAERVMIEAMTDGILERTPDDDLRATAPPAPGVSGYPATAVSPAPYGPPPLPPPPRTSVPPETTPPHARIEAGTTLNATYQLEAPLGAGGMGEVWVARHVRTQRKYAVKLLPASALGNVEAIKRFEREALAASALGHPNIVGVHDFHREGATPYLVMDLLEGETLESRLGRVGSLPWDDAKRIALELASALEAAHTAGLLHRDLKPSNVCLVPQPGGKERAVLLDFGLVKPTDEAAVSRITMTGMALGTPLYMSPEQARGEPLDVRSDVYALGAVLFEMLTGAPPFFERTIAAVYRRLLSEPAPSVSSVSARPCPPGVDRLLSSVLAKEKDARPPTARAFADGLLHVDDPVPVTHRMGA